MKLIIVGAGIAGRWLAKFASEEGHEVHLIQGDRAPAHLAGLAMIRPSYYSKELRALVPQSIDLWEQSGVEVIRGAEVTSWQRDDTRFQKDWFAFDPRQAVELSKALGIKHYFAEATEFTETSVVVKASGSNALPYILEGDAVVWCTSDGEDGEYSYGVTWVNRDPEALGDVPNFRVHHLAPYKTLVSTRYKGSCRIGSSSASSPQKAMDQAEVFLQKAVDIGWISSTEGWIPREGRRFKRDTLLTRGEAGWKWAGFHRSGYGIVPALASEVLKEVVSGAQA